MSEMPIVRIQIAEGRSEKQKRAVMNAVTDAIQESMEVARSTIHILIQEIPSENIMIGGEVLSDKLDRSED